MSTALLSAIVASLIFTVIVGAFIFYVGLQFGARMQESARRGMPPPTMFQHPIKIEVDEDLDQSEVIRFHQAQQQEFKAELEALNPEDLQGKAEFFNVAWDERPDQRDDMIDRIVTSRFNPGAFRA